MLKLLIIQPCIPEYRVSLYQNISKVSDIELCVKASKQDVDGLHSVELEESKFHSDLSLSESYLLGKKIIYQKGVTFNEIKKYDVVIITGNPRYINNYIYIVYCKLLGVKVVWWGQGWSANSNQLSYTIRMAIGRLTDGFIFYTDREKETASKSFFYNTSSAALNNGLDISKVDSAIKKVFVENTRSSNQILNLVFIGRVNVKSNFLFLLDSIRRLHIPVNLTVIGDGDLLGKSKVFCEKHKLNNVKFEGAIYEEEKLAAILLKQDCFIYPGAVGLSLIHAFLYSLPAIVHDNPKEHMPEIVAFENKVNGFGFEKDSEESLISTLAEVYKLKVEGNLIAYGKNARRVAEQNYTTQSMASRFVNFVKKIRKEC